MSFRHVREHDLFTRRQSLFSVSDDSLQQVVVQNNGFCVKHLSDDCFLPPGFPGGEMQSKLVPFLDLEPRAEDGVHMALSAMSLYWPDAQLPLGLQS
eukprot:8401631-Prorocentrum_lima.AAC.1